MEKPRNRKHPGSIKYYIFVGLLLLIIIFPVMPEGFRNITSFIFSYYFDETFRIDSTDVLLARLKPSISIKAEVIRVDSINNIDNWYEFGFALGPVINITKTFYMDAIYGLGIKSDGTYSNKGEINLTHETSTSVISFGARGKFFQSDDYYYFLPFMSGEIYPIQRLRLFCKLFFSRDNADVMTGAVWGEAGWTFTSLFTAYTGFTSSYADGFGYSIIGGFKLKFSEKFNIKYFCQYLSDTIEYSDVLEKKDGLANGLIVDIRF